MGDRMKPLRVASALLTSASLMISVALADDDRGGDRQRDGKMTIADDFGEDDDEGYAIGLWGDLPYSDEQAIKGVPNLIADMNAQHLKFTVHDGDLKVGSGIPGSVTPTTCS